MYIFSFIITTTFRFGGDIMDSCHPALDLRFYLFIYLFWDICLLQEFVCYPESNSKFLRGGGESAGWRRDSLAPLKQVSDAI